MEILKMKMVKLLNRFKYWKRRYLTKICWFHYCYDNYGCLIVRIYGYKYISPQYLAEILTRLKKSAGLSDGDIKKIKLWRSDYTKE